MPGEASVNAPVDRNREKKTPLERRVLVKAANDLASAS
jgi:hypothetical protein